MNALELVTAIKAREEVLFSTWREQLALQRKIFIPDGVVNPEKWIDTRVKVLFLLKEVNGGESEWDERDYLCKYNREQRYLKTHSPTVSALIQWIHAVNTVRTLTWQDVLSQTQEIKLQSELLEQVALVNVKKVPGGGIVDGEKFDAYWKEPQNIQNLRKQLKIYFSLAPPDFIVCGGTAWYYDNLFKDEKLVWETTSRGIPFCRHGRTIVIDYCHPQARIASNIKYYALLDAIQEIRAKDAKIRIREGN